MRLLRVRFTRVQHSTDEITATNPTVRAMDGGIFQPAEWRGITLIDTLRRTKNESRSTGNVVSDLSPRDNIRLFPSMDDVPIVLKQLPELPSVVKDVHKPGETSRHGGHASGVFTRRDKTHRSKVVLTVKEYRRYCSHFPTLPPTETHCMKQATIHTYRIGMPQRQQSSRGHPTPCKPTSSKSIP